MKKIKKDDENLDEKLRQAFQNKIAETLTKCLEEDKDYLNKMSSSMKEGMPLNELHK